MSESLKVVFDTQIYLRAAINPSSVCGKLFAEWTRYYVLFVSDGIEAEILNGECQETGVNGPRSSKR